MSNYYDAIQVSFHRNVWETWVIYENFFVLFIL